MTVRPLRYAGAALLGICLAAPLLAGPVAGVDVARVDSGSMRPTYAVGDLVVTRAVDPTEVRVGDVVRVDRRTDDDDLGHVHRVVAIDAGMLTMQGDGNDRPDKDPVALADVHGVVVGHVGGPAALAFQAFRSVPGQVVAATALVLLWPARAGQSRRRRTRHSAAARPVEARPVNSKDGTDGAQRA